MILLLLLGIGALCGADKLDRTYLPPPGSKHSGGSPDDILPPKESVFSSTTLRPQVSDYSTPQQHETYDQLGPITSIRNPEFISHSATHQHQQSGSSSTQPPHSDDQINPQGQFVQSIVMNQPGFVSSQATSSSIGPSHYQTHGFPTTTTSYAFSQTTTFSPNQEEGCVGGDCEYEQSQDGFVDTGVEPQISISQQVPDNIAHVPGNRVNLPYPRGQEPITDHQQSLLIQGHPTYSTQASVQRVTQPGVSAQHDQRITPIRPQSNIQQHTQRGQRPIQKEISGNSETYTSTFPTQSSDNLQTHPGSSSQYHGSHAQGQASPINTQTSAGASSHYPDSSVNLSEQKGRPSTNNQQTNSANIPNYQTTHSWQTPAHQPDVSSQYSDGNIQSTAQFDEQVRPLGTFDKQVRPLGTSPEQSVYVAEGGGAQGTNLPAFNANKQNVPLRYPSGNIKNLSHDRYSPQAIGSQKLGNHTAIGSSSHRPQADNDRNALILNYDFFLSPEDFAYSFDTSNGIHADESGTAVDGVKATGSYSYTGDDGNIYTITYTADENGYQPQGDHLPTPPPIPEAILRVIEDVKRNQAAGINDDGLYDEGKYGYKKYEGAMERMKPYYGIGSNDSPREKYKPSNKYHSTVSEEDTLTDDGTESVSSQPTDKYEANTKIKHKDQSSHQSTSEETPLSKYYNGRSNIGHDQRKKNDYEEENRDTLKPQHVASTSNANKYNQGKYVNINPQTDNNTHLTQGRPSVVSNMYQQKYNQNTPSVSNEDMYIDEDQYVDQPVSAFNKVQQSVQRRPVDSKVTRIPQQEQNNLSFNRKDKTKTQTQHNLPTNTDKTKPINQRRPIVNDHESEYVPEGNNEDTTLTTKYSPSGIYKQQTHIQNKPKEEYYDEVVPEKTDAYIDEQDEITNINKGENRINVPSSSESNGQRRPTYGKPNKKPTITIQDNIPMIRTGVDSNVQGTTRRPSYAAQDKEQINGYQYLPPSHKFDQGYEYSTPEKALGKGISPSPYKRPVSSRNKNTTLRPFTTPGVIQMNTEFDDDDDESDNQESTLDDSSVYTTPSTSYEQDSHSIRPISKDLYKEDGKLHNEYKIETGKPYSTKYTNAYTNEQSTRKPEYRMRTQRPGEIVKRPGEAQQTYPDQKQAFSTRKPMYYSSTTVPPSFTQDSSSSTDSDDNQNHITSEGKRPTTFRPYYDATSQSLSPESFVTDKITTTFDKSRPVTSSQRPFNRRPSDKFSQTTARPYYPGSGATGHVTEDTRTTIDGPFYPNNNEQSATSKTTLHPGYPARTYTGAKFAQKEGRRPETFDSFRPNGRDEIRTSQPGATVTPNYGSGSTKTYEEIRRPQDARHTTSSVSEQHSTSSDLDANDPFIHPYPNKNVSGIFQERKELTDVYGRPLATQDRVRGEDFSGPKQPARFDPKTGYHY